MSILALLLGVLPLTAQAQTVYKRQLPDGSIEFTDQRPKDAGAEEVIELSPVQTISAPPAPGFNRSTGQTSDGSSRESGGSYTVTIASPAPEEAIRANAGNFSVQVQIEPGLQDGHEVVVLLDGQEVAAGSSLSVSLSNIDRGAHTLSAVVRDAGGGELARSGSVTFYVLRVSVGQAVPGAGGHLAVVPPSRSPAVRDEPEPVDPTTNGSIRDRDQRGYPSV